MTRLLLKLSSFSFCILSAVDLYALPIYKNYQPTDIFTTKFKLGYFINHSNINNSEIDMQNKGINWAFEFNPFYATNFIHSLFMSINLNVFPNGKIKNNNIFITLNYYFPINILTPDWIPKIDLYSGGGYAVRFTKIKENLELNNFYINKYSNGPVLNLGIELTPKMLQNYGLACFIDYKFMWFEINSNMCNIKNNEKYKNTFVTIGVIYRSNFLTKINTGVN